MGAFSLFAPAAKASTSIKACLRACQSSSGMLECSDIMTDWSSPDKLAHDMLLMAPQAGCLSSPVLP